MTFATLFIFGLVAAHAAAAPPQVPGSSQGHQTPNRSLRKIVINVLWMWVPSHLTNTEQPRASAFNQEPPKNGPPYTSDPFFYFPSPNIGQPYIAVRSNLRSPLEQEEKSEGEALFALSLWTSQTWVFSDPRNVWLDTEDVARTSKNLFYNCKGPESESKFTENYITGELVTGSVQHDSRISATANTFKVAVGCAKIKWQPPNKGIYTRFTGVLGLGSTAHLEDPGVQSARAQSFLDGAKGSNNKLEFSIDLGHHASDPLRSYKSAGQIFLNGCKCNHLSWPPRPLKNTPFITNSHPSMHMPGYLITGQKGEPTILDPAHSFISLDPDTVKNHYRPVRGRKDQNGYWYFPCANEMNLPDLQIAMGADKATIRKSQFIYTKSPDKENQKCYGILQEKQPSWPYQVYGVPLFTAITLCFDTGKASVDWCEKTLPGQSGQSYGTSGSQQPPASGSYRQNGNQPSTPAPEHNTGGGTASSTYGATPLNENGKRISGEQGGGLNKRPNPKKRSMRPTSRSSRMQKRWAHTIKN